MEERSKNAIATSKNVNLVASLVILLSVVTNTLVVVTIAKTKQLHNKSQYIILSHAIAELIRSLAAGLTNNTRNYAYALLGMSDLIRKCNCVLGMVSYVASGKAQQAATFMLCLDRFLAIFLPIKYKSFRPATYVVSLNVACWGYALLAHVPFMFLGCDNTVILQNCDYLTALPSSYTQRATTEVNVIAVFTTICYCSIIVYAGYRYWGKKWQSESERANWSQAIQLNAVVFMTIVGLMYLICYGIATGMNSFFIWLGDQTLSRTYSPYIALLQTLNMSSHFFVYYACHKKFRVGFQQVFLTKKGTVATVQSITLTSRPAPARKRME